MVFSKWFFGMCACIMPLALGAQAMGNAQYNAQYNAPNVGAVRQNGVKIPLNVSVQDGQMVLQAEVLYNAKPQSYLAIFAVTQEDSLLESTEKYMSARIEAFRAAVAAMNINAQVFIDFISLVPKYDYQQAVQQTGEVRRLLRRSKTLNEVPTGFQMKKNVHILFSDGRWLDKIIAAAAQAEIYDLAKIEVNTSDIKKIQEELRAEATKIIQNKLAVFTALGIKNYPLSMGENFETYYPIENYDTYTAFTADASQLSNANMKHSKTTVKYATKDKTIFFNRVAYDQFDQVINPDFVEPPVQIHYKMVVKYAIKNIELAAKEDAERTRMLEKESIQQRDETEIRKIQAAHPPVPAPIIRN